MLWSKLFIPTLRENPAEAEVVSHQLLLRAGYIRQLAAGIYSYLFLAQRSLLKIMQIVREEMDAIGAQEMLLPALNPAEVWQESGPLGRDGRQHVPAERPLRPRPLPGHDARRGDDRHRARRTAQLQAAAADLVSDPDQVSRRAAPEVRPAARAAVHHEGLLLLRHGCRRAWTSSYEKHYDAYCKIFDRCGLEYMVVEAHSGAMGGSQSHEFMVASDAGEDFVVQLPRVRLCGESGESRVAPTRSRGSPIPKATSRRRSSTRRDARPSPKSPVSRSCPRLRK